jgi:hypothetical protein
MENFICMDGITNSLPNIEREVCVFNDWYVDKLENGSWLVSNKDLNIGVFDCLEDAMIFFMNNSNPIKDTRTEEKITEDLELLLKNGIVVNDKTI